MTLRLTHVDGRPVGPTLPLEVRLLPAREAHHPTLPAGRWLPVLGGGWVGDFTVVSTGQEAREVFGWEVEQRGEWSAPACRQLELAFYRELHPAMHAVAVEEEARGAERYSR